MQIQHLNCGIRELKFASNDSETMSFSGYGAVFGNVDAYGDVIKKGAFSGFLSDVKSGKQNWPAMLSQHGGFGADDMTPIGVWTDLSEDDTGLLMEGKFADTVRGREMYQLMKMEPRPAIDGFSIGYIAREWETRTKETDEFRRVLKRIDLMEVSIVTFPANGKARLGQIKSELTIRDAEQALREAGFSRTEAKAMLAEGFKSIPPRDAERVDELADIIRRNTAILSN
jgi:HK97 family phage prohead protease